MRGVVNRRRETATDRMGIDRGRDRQRVTEKGREGNRPRERESKRQRD